MRLEFDVLVMKSIIYILYLEICVLDEKPHFCESINRRNVIW